jgi:hypothetical protein
MRLALLALIPLLLPQDKPTWPQIVERGQKNLEREREFRAAIPREGFDPEALAKSLGGDPVKAAEFVRTRIAIEPVRGFVKGAQGALVSRRAGWADRALLLATLVADKSPSLVKGTLAAAKQPVFAVAPAPVPAVTAAEVAGRFKTDAARLEKKEKDSAAAAAAFRERLQARIRRDLDAVAEALQTAGVKPPAAVAAPSDEVWWVRIGDKDYERPEGAEERAVVALDLLLQADIAVKEAVLPKIQAKALFVEKRPLRLNARLYEFALARTSGTKEARGTAVVTFVRRIVDGRPAKIRAGFDLLANPATNLAAPAGWPENPAFAAGIADTALEHEVHRAPGPHANTSVQLEAAVAAKQALKVEQEGGRIRVVVPGKTRAWYEIDPVTGGCLGFMEEGGGQDMAEYATLLADRLEEIREFQSHVDLVNSILECAMNALEAADSEASFARCAAGVAIGEAFGWASGGIIDGAAGDNPYARLGGMALGDMLGDALDAAMGATPLGR